MTDYTDPESPVADPHTDRPEWKPVYMGEGHRSRCDHCGMTLSHHDWEPVSLGTHRYCRESYLRMEDGDR